MPVISTSGAMSAKGFGFGGISFLQATGGTITNETINGILYKVHTFTSNGNFVITNPGPDKFIEAFLWGGGGGLGGFTEPGGIAPGRDGGDGGGAAYARNLGLTVSTETLSVCVGGAGGFGVLSGGGGGGSAGTGITISSTNFFFGGRGGNAGSSGFSGAGGGAGGASAILRSTTGLIVASGGGGGGGNQRVVPAGNGGGGGTDGTAGSVGAGGIVGTSGSTNGQQGPDGGGADCSSGGGGGGGVAGGGAGGTPGGDLEGAGGGAGGTSTAGTGTGTAVVNGGVITQGNDNFTSYNNANYGRGGGSGFMPAFPNANPGIVVIRYPIQG